MTYKSDFPIFTTHPGLIYLDSAASSQKPETVINVVNEVYGNYANVHRGLYPLSLKITEEYEKVREITATFLNAKAKEIVFTKSGTEALNVLAFGLTENLQEDDEIILSELEHHANLVPWQQVAKQRRLILKFIRLTKTGEIDLTHFAELITPRTKIVSVAHCSNVLGTITLLPELKKILQNQGSDARVIADACQSVPHFPVNVQTLQADFLIFSGHKVYAPSGTGVLWGRAELLASLPPFLTGGDMVRTVSREQASWQDVPHKFEAGTPNIEGVIGLGAALTYLQGIGMEKVAAHTAELMNHALQELSDIPEVTLLSTPDPQSGIIAFTLKGVHPHDVAQMLGERHVCIRAGHHCAAPLHQGLDISGSNRISIGIYNDQDDITAFITALKEVITFFHV